MVRFLRKPFQEAMARFLRKPFEEAISLHHRVIQGSSSARSSSLFLSKQLHTISRSQVFPPPDRQPVSRFYGMVRFYRQPPLHTQPRFQSAPPLPRASIGFKGCRSYYVDTRGVEHFRRRGFGGADGKSRVRQYVLVTISGVGIFTVVYFSNQEVIPYTYRKHFVLLSPDFEIKLVEDQYEALKKQWSSEILPPFHPQAMRVRRIAQDIIRAVLEGTRMEEWENVQIKYNGKVHSHVHGEGNRPAMLWGSDPEFSASAQTEGHDEVIDDRWVDECRSKGLKRGDKPFVEHLKKMKWEVLVVDKDIVNAFCLPGGKIVVFTGLLKRFPSDAEIATVMGHEVAHVVARHNAERMTRHIFVVMMELAILAFFYAPDLIRAASTLLLELPFSRSQELEADHVGLLLMAAAGYNPGVAPSLYEKLGEVSGSSELLQYVTTHPSGKLRGERLRKTGTMEEALLIYQERAQGRVVEGFL